MPDATPAKPSDDRTVVAKAFIFYRNHMTGDDQILLLVRSATDPHRPGGLDIPGGAVDRSESLPQAVAREIQEEAGIAVDPAALHEVNDSGVISNQTSVEKHVFVTRIEEPDFTLSFEHESAAWYPVEEAARLFVHPFYGKVLQFVLDNKLNETT